MDQIQEDNINQDESLRKAPKLYLFSSWYRLAFILFLALSLFFVTAFVVVLLLTKSEGLVSVPNVKHKYLVDVFNALSRKGLKIELDMVDMSALGKGYILDQNPKAGVLVRPGQKIVLIINRGSLATEVPDLVGKPLTSVESLLSSVQVGGKTANLKVGEITSIGTNEEKAGIILAQIPRASEQISANAVVHLLVSSGPVRPGFRMANYVNQDIDLLYDAFEMRDIQIQYKIQNVNDKKFHGRVMAQYPAVGVDLQKGSAVQLTIGMFSEEFYHRIGYELVRYQVSADLGDKPLEVYIKDKQPKRRRYRKLVRPGEVIQTVVRREGSAEITFESNGKVLRTMEIQENKSRQ